VFCGRRWGHWQLAHRSLALPLAPAATLLDRFPAAFARVAAAIGVDRALLDAELRPADAHPWPRPRAAGFSA